jgi:hypothetical protein
VNEKNNSNENSMTTDTINQTETKSEMTPKNKWFYPRDEFGKMEKGIEFDSKTYLRDKKDNNSNDFTIL